MTNPYDELTEEEKRQFEEGYDEWLHEMNPYDVMSEMDDPEFEKFVEMLHRDSEICNQVSSMATESFSDFSASREDMDKLCKDFETVSSWGTDYRIRIPEHILDACADSIAWRTTSVPPFSRVYGVQRMQELSSENAYQEVRSAVMDETGHLDFWKRRVESARDMTVMRENVMKFAADKPDFNFGKDSREIVGVIGELSMVGSRTSAAVGPQFYDSWCDTLSKKLALTFINNSDKPGFFDYDLKQRTRASGLGAGEIYNRDVDHFRLRLANEDVRDLQDQLWTLVNGDEKQSIVHEKEDAAASYVKTPHPIQIFNEFEDPFTCADRAEYNKKAVSIYKDICASAAEAEEKLAMDDAVRDSNLWTLRMENFPEDSDYDLLPAYVQEQLYPELDKDEREDLESAAKDALDTFFDQFWDEDEGRVTDLLNDSTKDTFGVEFFDYVQKKEAEALKSHSKIYKNPVTSSGLSNLVKTHSGYVPQDEQEKDSQDDGSDFSDR